jgi:6-phosphogluconolactonase
VANEVPQQNTTRITFTYPLINNAHAVMFLVVGASKAPALKRVLHGPRQVSVLPSQGVAPTSGTLEWYVDSAAASELSSTF